MDFNISLKKTLSALADLGLPRFSGDKKILEVIIRMDYAKRKFQHLKIIFWRPNNSMLVGYDFETNHEDLSQEVTVTANHDSTWRHDGFSFLNKFEKPASIEILSAKVIGIKSCDFTDHEDFTYILEKQ